MKNNTTRHEHKELLLYITHGFPYHSHSPFSKEEFPFLLKDDREITLLPRVGEAVARTPLPAETLVSNDLLVSRWIKLAHAFSPETVWLLQNELASCRRMGTPFAIKNFFRAAGIALQTKHAVLRLLTHSDAAEKPVVLYSYWFSEAVAGLGLIKNVFPHCRIIARGHGSDLYPWQHANGYMPFRHLRKQWVDTVLPCSSFGAELLLADGYAPEQIRIARLGVSPSEGLAAASPPGQLVLASVSSLQPMKRIPLLIDSLESLAHSGQELTISWHHLGGGEGFEAFRKEIATRLTPIANLTYTLHGQTPSEAVREFFVSRPLDGLINVSSSEGIPVSMMEAMSAGVPVLGTNVGGTNEIITPDTGVLLTEDFSPQEFIVGAKRLMEWKNPERRRQVAAFQKRHYDQKSNYLEFAEYLEQEMTLSGKRLKFA